MSRHSLLALSLLTPSLAFAQAGPKDPHPQTSYVAVVIGISAYEHMPEEVELDFARSDAATVAGALQDGGRFDVVKLLTDRNATKAAVTEMLREDVAQYIGPKDVLLVYFVGHGIAADLGQPTLLAYDSTVQNGQEDGFDVEAFARDIATWTRAGTTILVTDAIHKNQLDGIYFYGPAANEWPGIGPNTLVLSSSKSREPARDGEFGLIFADGMSGAADANADGTIIASEITDYLGTRFADGRQTPSFGGNYRPDLILAQGVIPGATASSTGGVDLTAVYGEHEVYAAKFVFRDGSQPTIECRDQPKLPCDSSCYVRNFKAGPCRLSAFVDGAEAKGVTLAMIPGKYDCGLRADKSLACIPPQPSPSTPAK